MKFKKFIDMHEDYSTMVINDPFFRMSSGRANFCSCSNEDHKKWKTLLEKDIYRLNLNVKELFKNDEDFLDNWFCAFEVDMSDYDKGDRCKQLRRLLNSMNWIFLYQQDDNDNYKLYKDGAELNIFNGIHNPVIGLNTKELN